MRKKLPRDADSLSERLKRKKNWRKILWILGCMVMFCTTYALIIPAITLDRTATSTVQEQDASGSNTEGTASAVPDSTVADSQNAADTALVDQAQPETTDPGTLFQTTLTAKLYTDESFSQQLSDNTVITVSGQLPADVEARAYPVDVTRSDLNVFCAYDISLYHKDGTLYENDASNTLAVSIQSAQVSQAESQSSPDVYYLPDDGDPQPMGATVSDDAVSFDTTHFSAYLVAAPVETSVNANPDAVVMTASNNTVDSVNNEAELRSAVSAGHDIELAGDFSVTGSVIVLPAGHITMNLNGHILTVNGSESLFIVGEGATLTIKDGQAPSETVTDDTLPDSGSVKTATLGAADIYGKRKLTYYVTDSAVSNSDNDLTTETCKKHEVTGNGTIKYGTDNNSLFSVTGGMLNIQSGMICPTDSNPSNRAIAQSVGTTNLTGGYICGFKVPDVSDQILYRGGAFYASGGTLNIGYSGVLAANTAACGGAVYAENATVQQTGGTVSGNTSSWRNVGINNGGGGIYLNGRSTYTLSAGFVTNNQCTALENNSYYYDGGGGVMVAGSSVLNMGGNSKITGNTAANGGGGIRLATDSTASLNMTGGFVCHNYAGSAEGGGITLMSGTTGTITGGYINNNTTATSKDWGGGGVFGSYGSKLYLQNALITQNHAEGFGGGVAGCSTGKIFVAASKGTAIFDNTANVTSGTLADHLSGTTSAKNEDHTYGENDPIFMNNGYADYFCALNSVVEGTMLGGYAANWTGSSDGSPVVVGKDDTLNSSYICGLTAHPTDAGKTAARSTVNGSANGGVHITGNSSNTHGGGILINGDMVIGDTTDIYVGSRIELHATKALLDSSGTNQTMTDGEFTFTVTDYQTGAVITTGTNDANGNITFKDRLPFNQAGTHSYYIQEDPSSDKTIIQDTTKYLLQVVVTDHPSVFATNADGSTRITKHQYEVDKINVMKFNGVEDSDGTIVQADFIPVNDESHAINFNLTPNDTITFTNVKQSTTKISVKKIWNDQLKNHNPITVKLYRNSANNTKTLVNSQQLNGDNNWSYTWTNLSLSSDYSYSVEEDAVSGYTPEYNTSTTTESESYFVPVGDTESLTAGQQYIIVSNDNLKALKITSEHVDAGLNTSDLTNVTYHSGSVTVGGVQYSGYYTADGISSSNIFKAESHSQLGWDSNNTWDRTVLKNNSVSSWLLFQNYTFTDSNNPSNSYSNSLKGTNSADYASGIEYNEGLIRGSDHTGGNWSNKSCDKVLVYDGTRFSAASSADNNAAKLYKLVTDAGTNITITNTKTENQTFTLDITKKSDYTDTRPQVTLAGAEFQLIDSDRNVLYFKPIGGDVSSAYSLTTAADSNGTTTLVTDSNGKLVLSNLPAGSYTLHETKAPSGYAKAADQSVTLGGSNAPTIKYVTVIDNKYGEYALPGTGGFGTIGYTISGLLLMAGTLVYGYGKRRRRERRDS
ncbi:MAG: SpaA isopeptide-forming pilin-related protein [Eubacteriaceae bacterium]|jgi:LPXTG-motif cell wall-anchored protein